MRIPFPTFLVFLALAGAARGQTVTAVVPAANTVVEGNALEAKPFYIDRQRLTQLFDGTLVGVPFGKTITEIAYRRDKTAVPTQTMQRRTIPTWSLRLANLDYNAPPQTVGRVRYPGGQAWNPRNPLGIYLHPALTRNRLVEVYNKPTQFPALPPVTGAVAPFAIVFKLDRPFLYSGPHGLAIDHYTYEQRAAQSLYIVDAVRSSVDSGTAVPFGKSCPDGKNRAYGISSNPGGEPLSLILFDGRPQTAAIVVLGGSNKNWGPIGLPWNLQLFGLPTCSLYVSVDLLLPLATFSNGSAEARLEVPPESSLAGFRFFAQWMVLDPSINPGFPLTFSNGVDLTLGRTVGNTSMPAAFIYGVGNIARSTYGFVDKNIALVTRIGYQ